MLLISSCRFTEEAAGFWLRCQQREKNLPAGLNLLKLSEPSDYCSYRRRSSKEVGESKVFFHLGFSFHVQNVYWKNCGGPTVAPPPLLDHLSATLLH